MENKDKKKFVFSKIGVRVTKHVGPYVIGIVVHSDGALVSRNNSVNIMTTTILSNKTWNTPVTVIWE